MAVLTSQRLQLRRLTVDDAAALHRIHHEPGVWAFYTGQPPATAEDERAMIEQHLARHPDPEEGFRAVILRQTGEFIGLCGLLAQEVDGQPEHELAYVLSPRFWGRGLAAEAARRVRDFAFAHLHCARLVALIRPDNLASKRVAIATGLRFQRTVRFRDIEVEVYCIAKTECAG
jgi:RimJ/RimL family protein N-acetyltransferase